MSLIEEFKIPSVNELWTNKEIYDTFDLSKSVENSQNIVNIFNLRFYFNINIFDLRTILGTCTNEAKIYAR